MKRRSSAGGKPAKPRVPKRPTPKGGNAPKAERNRGASIVGQETVVARLTRERDEALLRETANSEILRLISSSPGDLELVFRTILEDATRICNADFGTLFRFDGEKFYPVAQFNTPAALLEAQSRRGPFQPEPGTAMEHVLRTKQVSHSADKTAEPAPGFFAEHGGARSQVAVPMLKNDLLIGVIVIYRQEVRPFTDKQIALLQNFAAQAVIAIENARLLNELRESLEQQIGTAEVLQVISSSPGELKPVFDAMLQNATRICEAKFGTLYLREGEGFRTVAAPNAPPAYIEARTRELIRPPPDTALGSVAATKRVVHIVDIKTIPSYVERNPFSVIPVELGGYRTVLAVPMLKNNELIGIITINRQEVRPFTDKQISLVENFAAQAVIAIENARLLNELRESLQQQTATADVLRIVSCSPGDLKPVFTIILDKALHLCEAAFGFVTTYDGVRIERVAQRGVPEALAAYFEAGMDQARPGDAHWRLVEGEDLIHSDQKEEDAYRLGNPLRRAVVDLGGARTALVVALRKDKALLGALTVYRKEVRPFTDQQISLVKNFAAQAVIAIENARLLSELRQRTEEVLKLNQQLEGRVADQVGEIERMSRLRRFLPPQVADLIVASGTEKQLESHRREITALFCDLRGFTGFSESSDPEDVMALVSCGHRHNHQ
jgi:GAF domain-containing protein